MIHTAAALADRLDGLSADAFEAFVADLWDARGWDTERDGDLLVCTHRERGERVRVFPHRPRREAEPEASIPPATDTVVTATADADVPPEYRLVGPTELYRMIRHGIDREVGQALLDDHLGAELPVVEPGSGAGADAPAEGDSGASAAGAADGSGDGRHRDEPSIAEEGEVGATDGDESADGITEEADNRASGASAGETDDAAAVGEADGPVRAELTERTTRRALLAAAGGGFVAGVGLLEAARSLVDPGAPASTTADETDETATPTRFVPVPGLTESGVSDPTALANTHAAVLADVSYSLRSRRAIHGADGRLRSSVSLDVALDANRTYLAQVSTEGPQVPELLGPPPATATFWSDDERYLRRFTRDGETTYNTFDPPDGHTASWQYWVRTVPFGGQNDGPDTYFGAVFESVPTALASIASEGGERVYTLRDERADDAVDDPDWTVTIDGVEDVTLDATVASNGLIRSFRLWYDGRIEGDAVTVKRAIDYTGVGRTTVDRPSWYDRAVDGE